MTNQQITEVHCLRCGHTWTPRKTGRPVSCPNVECRSRDWDKPRKRPPVRQQREDAEKRKQVLNLFEDLPNLTRIPVMGRISLGAYEIEPLESLQDAWVMVPASVRWQPGDYALRTCGKPSTAARKIFGRHAKANRVALFRPGVDWHGQLAHVEQHTDAGVNRVALRKIFLNQALQLVTMEPGDETAKLGEVEIRGVLLESWPINAI